MMFQRNQRAPRDNVWPDYHRPSTHVCLAAAHHESTCAFFRRRYGIVTASATRSGSRPITAPLPLPGTAGTLDLSHCHPVQIDRAVVSHKTASIRRPDGAVAHLTFADCCS